MAGGYVIVPLEIYEITADLEPGESKVVPGIYNIIKEYHQLGKLVMSSGNGRFTPIPVIIIKGENYIAVTSVGGDVMFSVTDDDRVSKP